MSNPSIYEPTMYAIDPSGTKLGRIRLQGQLSLLWTGTATAADGRQYDCGVSAAGINRRKARVVLLYQARQYFSGGKS